MPPINDAPPRRLLSWGVLWAGEPRKGQQCVTVAVWVPAELARWETAHCWDSGRCRLTRLADYLWEHLGFVVCTSGGWGSGDAIDDLVDVDVPVRARDIKRALAATAPGTLEALL